jgi:hypothetical protein
MGFIPSVSPTILHIEQCGDLVYQRNISVSSPTVICQAVGFEVLTPVVLMCCIIWDITTCSPLKVNRRF